MNEDEINTFRQSPIYPLMPLLRTGVLHRTSVEGLRGIHEIGSILPNKGQLPCSHPRTKGYYGYSIGCISLFDFESAEEKDYRKNYHYWEDFFGFRSGKPLTVVLKLNREELTHKLIPSSGRPKSREEGHKPAIAFVEVWYPEAIPISAIGSYIVTWQLSRFHEIIASQFFKEERGELDRLLSLSEEELVQAVKERSKTQQ